MVFIRQRKSASTETTETKGTKPKVNIIIIKLPFLKVCFCFCFCTTSQTHREIEEQRRILAEIEQDRRKVTELSGPMLELITQMKSSPAVSQQTKLKVLKSTKVRPRGMLASLRKFEQHCVSDTVRTQVGGVIARIEQNLGNPAGLSEVFTCAEQGENGEQFEFLCLAVRVYRYDGETACDFALSNYAQKTQAAEWAAGLGFGDSREQHPVKQLAEAMFLNELIEGGYATVDNKQRLFISPD